MISEKMKTWNVNIETLDLQNSLKNIPGSMNYKSDMYYSNFILF